MSTTEDRVTRLLQELGACVTPIPTEAVEKKRTPDLLVYWHSVELIVEIKALEENSKEALALRAVEAGEVASVDHSGDVARLAAKIRDANNQLKRKCHGKPGVTVVVDERSFFTRALSLQQVLAEAMFGAETLWLTMPGPSNPGSSQVVAHDFGRGRTVSPNANTTTSAVGLLASFRDGSDGFLLHHNPHAASPLPRGIFLGPRVREFIIPSTREFAAFAEVVSDST